MIVFPRYGLHFQYTVQEEADYVRVIQQIYSEFVQQTGYGRLSLPVFGISNYGR